MERSFAGHGDAAELAGEPDGQVGDVDGLLDFTLAFGADLADFEGDEFAEG